MGELRKISDVSSDGLRKVEINEVDASSCIIRLYNDNFCMMDIITKENVFELNRTKLSNRKYLSFADDYIQYGFGEMSMSDIERTINSASRRNCKCGIKFYFKNGLTIDLTGSYYYPSVQLDIGNQVISSNAYFTRYKYSDLACKSVNELFDMSEKWNVIKLNGGVKEDGIGNCLCEFMCGEFTFCAYKDVLEGFRKTSYLKKMDYLNTKSVLNLSNITDKDKRDFTKAKILGKKVMIAYIKSDATPVFVIVM